MSGMDSMKIKFQWVGLSTFECFGIRWLYIGLNTKYLANSFLFLRSRFFTKHSYANISINICFIIFLLNLFFLYSILEWLAKTICLALAWLQSFFQAFNGKKKSIQCYQLIWSFDCLRNLFLALKFIYIFLVVSEKIKMKRPKM